jgi:predicted Zn-dependent protease with MMP-like domain
MDVERFEKVVGDAVDTLPDWVQRYMENVVIVVEDRNEGEPDLLGLYEGNDLTERGEYGLAAGGLLPLPDVIAIYREAILDVCDDEADVEAEVRTTVIHEIAHHFGIDDDRLDELGWS